MDNDVKQKIELVDNNIGDLARSLAGDNKNLEEKLKLEIREIILQNDLKSSSQETNTLIKILTEENTEASTETIVKAKEASLSLDKWAEENIEAVRIYRGEDFKNSLIEETKNINPNITEEQINSVKSLADNFNKIYNTDGGIENQKDFIFEEYKNESPGKIKNAWHDLRGNFGLLKQKPQELDKLINDHEKITNDLREVDLPYQRNEKLASYDRVMSSIKNPEMRRFMESSRARFKTLDRISNGRFSQMSDGFVNKISGGRFKSVANNFVNKSIVKVSNGFASKIGNQAARDFVQKSMGTLLKNGVSSGMKSIMQGAMKKGVQVAGKAAINVAAKMGLKAAALGLKAALGAATAGLGYIAMAGWEALKLGGKLIGKLIGALGLELTNNKFADTTIFIVLVLIVLLFGMNTATANIVSSLVPEIETKEGINQGESGGNPNYNWGKYVENMESINTYTKINNEGLCNGDMTKYQIELEAKIDQGGGKRTRYGVASAAQYLAFDFPFWVPYYWGGGHGDIDLNGGFLEKGESYTTNWGCERFQGHEGAGKAYNTWRKNGLDCSGFVTWAYNSAGFRDWSGSDEYRWKKGLFNRIGFGSSNCEKIKSLVQPGDVLKRDTPSSHTAIVLASDDNRIKYAQEGGSGKGLNIGFIDICTGKGSTSFQFFISMDNYFNTLGTK